MCPSWKASQLHVFVEFCKIHHLWMLVYNFLALTRRAQNILAKISLQRLLCDDFQKLLWCPFPVNSKLKVWMNICNFFITSVNVSHSLPPGWISLKTPKLYNLSWTLHSPSALSSARLPHNHFQQPFSGSSRYDGYLLITVVKIFSSDIFTTRPKLPDYCARSPRNWNQTENQKREIIITWYIKNA